MAQKKNPAAVALAKLRAKKLSAEERSEIASRGGNARVEGLDKAERIALAKKAAAARWGKRKER